jgi:hypothetical protein
MKRKQLRSGHSLEKMLDDKRLPKGGLMELKQIIVKFEPQAKRLIEKVQGGDLIGTPEYNQ